MAKSGYSGIEWSCWDELLICGSSVRSRQGPLAFSLFRARHRLANYLHTLMHGFNFIKQKLLHISHLIQDVADHWGVKPVINQSKVSESLFLNTCHVWAIFARNLFIRNLHSQLRMLTYRG